MYNQWYLPHSSSLDRQVIDSDQPLSVVALTSFPPAIPDHNDAAAPLRRTRLTGGC